MNWSQTLRVLGPELTLVMLTGKTEALIQDTYGEEQTWRSAESFTVVMRSDAIASIAVRSSERRDSTHDDQLLRGYSVGGVVGLWRESRMAVQVVVAGDDRWEIIWPHPDFDHQLREEQK